MKTTTTLKIITFLIVFASCKQKSKQDISLDCSIFNDIKKIESCFNNDTINFTIYDDSYIYDAVYDHWKMNYLLWKNKKIFELNTTIKITVFHQNGDGINYQYICDRESFNEIKQIYESNSNFDSISDIILTKFSPTEILNLRNVNNFLNKEFDGPKLPYDRILYNFSLCKDSCFEYNRLLMINKVLKITGMNDFWTHEMIDAEELIKKIEEITVFSGINNDKE